MRVFPHPPARHALPLALFALLSANAHAARVDYAVGIGVLRSDNIGLDAVNERSDTVVAPQLRFDIEQTGSVLQLTGRGQLQYLDYVDDTFDDGFRGAFSGQALWTMLPDRLTWTFEDYLSRQPVDSFSTFSPANEQQTNLFVTGPSLLFRLGPSTRGQFDLRYSNSYAEENDTFDSDRYNLAARVLRDLSPTRILSANVEATRVAYSTSGLNADYLRYDGYARYWSQFRLLELTVDLGYSRLEFENRDGDEWLPLARTNLTWRPSPRSTLDASLGYEFSDAAQNLTFGQVDGVGGNGSGGDGIDDGSGAIGDPSVPVTADVFKQQRLELGYRFTGERFTFEVRPFYQRIEYVESLSTSERSLGGYARVGYALGPATTLSLAGAREDRRFDGLSRTDTETVASLALDHAFSRHWDGRVSLQRRQRSSPVAGQTYDENAAFLSLAYRR